jgi:hypothetical protein
MANVPDIRPAHVNTARAFAAFAELHIDRHKRPETTPKPEHVQCSHFPWSFLSSVNTSVAHRSTAACQYGNRFQHGNRLEVTHLANRA